MISIQTSSIHQRFPLPDDYNVLCSGGNPRTRGQGSNQSCGPLYPIRQKSTGVGILRMSPYINEIDSDLISNEIKKLSKNSDFQYTDRLPKTFDPYTCEFPPFENETDSGNRKQPSSPFKTSKKFHKSALIKTVIENLSPRTLKKVKEVESRPVSTSPVWPNSMSTYARGVSEHGAHNMFSPPEPSLASLRVQERLELTNKMNDAVQSFADVEDETSKMIYTFESMDSEPSTPETPSQNGGTNPTIHDTNKTTSNEFFYGQSPFDDNFDPSIHKPNLNRTENINIPNTKHTNNWTSFPPTVQNSKFPNQVWEEDQNASWEQMQIGVNPMDNAAGHLRTASPSCSSPRQNVRICNNFIILDEGAPTDSVFV